MLSCKNVATLLDPPLFMEDAWVEKAKDSFYICLDNKKNFFESKSYNKT